MIQHSFTAQELFCMVLLSNKKYMYGIPNAFDDLPIDERRAQVQIVTNSLSDTGIAIMNFDGNTELSPEYDEIVSFISDCDKCLTVNIQKGIHLSECYIFWRLGNRYLMAEATGSRYILSSTSSALIYGLLERVWFCSTSCHEEAKISVPQVVLAKAKRLCLSGKSDEAFRVLRQNGADEATVVAIIDGLEEKADCLNFSLIDNYTQEVAEQTFLVSRGQSFELGQAVVNMRTCATLKYIEGKASQDALSRVADIFLKN